MKISLKAMVVKVLAIGTLAGAVAFVAPAKAKAQGFGVGVQFGNAYTAPYAPGYGDSYEDHHRREEWRRHEDWVRQQEWARQQEWLRHQEWERARHFSDRREYGSVPFGYYGR